MPQCAIGHGANSTYESAAKLIKILHILKFITCFFSFSTIKPLTLHEENHSAR